MIILFDIKFFTMNTHSSVNYQKLTLISMIGESFMWHNKKIVAIALLALNSYGSSLFSTKNDIFKEIYADCGINTRRIKSLKSLWNYIRECDEIDTEKAFDIARLFLVEPSCNDCLWQLKCDYIKIFDAKHNSSNKNIKNDIQKLIIRHAKQSRNAHAKSKDYCSKKSHNSYLSQLELHDECEKTLIQIEKEKNIDQLCRTIHEINFFLD